MVVELLNKEKSVFSTEPYYKSYIEKFITCTSNESTCRQRRTNIIKNSIAKRLKISPSLFRYYKKKKKKRKTQI